MKILYRKGTPEDWSGIATYLRDTEYFLPVDVEALGGTWFLAEQGGKLKATLWFFGETPHAYIDYFAASSPVVARRIMAKTQAMLAAHGVRYIRATVPLENRPMLRLANAFGFRIALDYTTIFKEII